MTENWIDIEGYDGYYQVSDLGRVRSIKKNGKIKIIKPELFQGYHRVTLTKHYKQNKYLVHRLVCKEFNGKPECINSQVDHINTIRTDNRPSNLRWVSNKENCNNPITKQHMSEGQIGKVGCWKGKHFSEEHRKRIGDGNRGKTMSEEIRNKISESKRNKK